MAGGPMSIGSWCATGCRRPRTFSQLSARKEAWWNLPFTGWRMKATSWALFEQVREGADHEVRSDEPRPVRLHAAPSTREQLDRAVQVVAIQQRWTKRGARCPFRPSATASGFTVGAACRCRRSPFRHTVPRHGRSGMVKRKRSPVCRCSPAASTEKSEHRPEVLDVGRKAS